MNCANRKQSESPSRQDGEVPLIVAHPRRSEGSIRDLVRRSIAGEPRQQKVTDALLALRFADGASR